MCGDYAVQPVKGKRATSIVWAAWLYSQEDGGAWSYGGHSKQACEFINVRAGRTSMGHAGCQSDHSAAFNTVLPPALYVGLADQIVGGRKPAKVGYSL